MTEIEETIKSLKEMFPKGLCEVDEYKMAQVAINALEKQIPKKPITIDYGKYVNVTKNARFLRGACWCPNCKHVVKCGTYCSDCGQKLDWSDTN